MTDSVKFCNVRALLGLGFAIAILAGCAAPRPAPVRDGTPPPPADAAPAAPQTAVGTHAVRPGDTLLGIARQYGVTVRDLVAWNGLGDPNQIHVGQVLRVTAEPPPSGVVVQPVGPQVEIQPVRPPAELPPAGPAVKQEPKGGTQPYSDEVWAALRPRSADVPPPAKPAEPAAGDIANGDTAWLWPASGQVIETFDEATNKGVDIAGKPGDPVIASAGGKVVYSGSGLRGYGKLVIIKHDANYLTAYAHNQQLLVKEGDSVSKGQKIAELGSTDADRPKVHFEIRKQGRPVDPLKYLPPR